MRSGKGWCPFATQVEGVTKFDAGGPAKVGFCDHTAGGFYTTLATAGFWNGAGDSVHFAIGRKGEIAQMVNIFDRAWGQGRDANGGSVGPASPGVMWPAFSAMAFGNPNLYLISTEHEDAITVDGRTVFVQGPTWTPEQYAADLRVKQWCRAELAAFNQDVLVFGIDSLAGHYMFDPVNRKNCPGPIWETTYRKQLYNDLIGGTMANISIDGSIRWVDEAGCAVLYVANVPVLKVGPDPANPNVGLIAKNFGGTWMFFRGLLDSNPPTWAASPYWSTIPGD